MVIAWGWIFVVWRYITSFDAAIWLHNLKLTTSLTEQCEWRVYRWRHCGKNFAPPRKWCHSTNLCGNSWKFCFCERLVLVGLLGLEDLGKSISTIWKNTYCAGQDAFLLPLFTIEWTLFSPTKWQSELPYIRTFRSGHTYFQKKKIAKIYADNQYIQCIPDACPTMGKRLFQLSQGNKVRFLDTNLSIKDIKHKGIFWATYLVD